MATFAIGVGVTCADSNGAGVIPLTIGPGVMWANAIGTCDIRLVSGADVNGACVERLEMGTNMTGVNVMGAFVAKLLKGVGTKGAGGKN